MIYVYEDEVESYLAMGYPEDQLTILPYGVDKPESPKFDQKVWEHSMKMNEIRKVIREVIYEAVTFDNNKTFIPPPNVAQRAQEALNAVSNNNQTESGSDHGSGLNKAKELASKQNQGYDMLSKMKSFFETHQEASNAEKAAGKTVQNSGPIQAWELHGGDSGKEWVNQQLGSLNQSNLNTKKNLRLAGGAGTNKGMGVFDTTTMDTTKQRIHR